MTNRAPGTYLDRLHSKPWFHSGKVAEIKYSYSASGLTPSLYPIRPRSKVPGGDDRLAKLEFKTYPNIDQLTKQNLFVDFREYQFLRDYETLVTVEHCDSCETHANSTHHDPKQYSSLAQSLSNTILARYPSVKVMIKPISRLGMNYMRIGAFEVQICSKSNGSLNKNTLHSKLQTKKWPDLQEIVMKLSDYLPRCHISVTVFDIENGDNLLKEMHVSLRPKRLGLQLSTTMRPKSASFSTFRPGSAISTMSLRTIKFSARRNARTLLKSGKKQNKSLEGVTNREGVCLFNHVPMNIYEIEVGEDKEYRGEVKVINMFEELTQNSNVNIYVGLIPKNECELTVNLYDPGVKTEIPYAHVKLIDSSQGLHYLYEVSRGKYQLSVPKGVYVLRVDSDDFKELSKELQLLKTELIITENLKQKDSRDVQILTFNALTGDKLGGVLIKLKTSETQGFMQGLSRSGSYTYNLTHTGLFNVECFKKGYYDVNVTTYIWSRDNLTINISLVPLELSNASILVFSWTRNSDDIEIEAFNEQGTFNYKSAKSDGLEIIDMLRSNGTASLVIENSVCKQLRVIVKVLTNELVNENELLNSGLSINLYKDGQILGILPSLGSGNFWDIGIFSVGEFFETNVISSIKISKWNEFLDDFITFIDLIKASGSLSNCFNFGKYGVQKSTFLGKDTVISLAEFSKILNRIMSDEGLAYIIKSLKNEFGISLNFLKSRYEKYQDLTNNSPPSQLSVEEYSEIIGINPELDHELLWIAYQASCASLPEGWIAIHDYKGKIKYWNRLDGSMTEENPNNEYYINMFHDYKKSSDEAKIAKEIAQKEAKIKEEIEKTRLKKEAKKREKESAWFKLLDEYKQDCHYLLKSADESILNSPQFKEDITKDTTFVLEEKTKSYISRINQFREYHSEESSLISIDKSVNLLSQFYREHLQTLNNELESIENSSREIKKSKTSSNSSKSNSSEEYDK